MCRDNQNRVLTQKDQILNRWKDYYHSLLIKGEDGLLETPKTQFKRIHSQQDTEILDPTYNETCFIINNLKNGKAGGTDNILPEMIKYGGRALKQRIHKLLLKIWEDEQLPSQWNEGIICPVYKNGDRLDCKNYRPTTLSNIIYIKSLP